MVVIICMLCFQKGIYADMAAGIRKSKLMLACISDEVRKLSLFTSLLSQSLRLYSKTCLKRSLKKDKIKVLKTNYSLMKLESIAECSLGAFCNTFDLHLARICLENQVFVSILSGRLRQVLL